MKNLLKGDKGAKIKSSFERTLAELMSAWDLKL